MYLAHSAKGDILAQFYRWYVCNVSVMAFGMLQEPEHIPNMLLAHVGSVTSSDPYHDLGKLAPEISRF